MAKYQIATPAGYEVEVTASTPEEALQLAERNWQTMPKIIARTPDQGRVFERPNGQKYFVGPNYSTTDPAKVEEILAGLDAGKVSRDGIQQDILAQHPVASRATAFVGGVPFAGQYADELVGAMAGPDAAAGHRALAAAQEEQRPLETLGLNLAGAGTAAAGLVAAAPSAAAYLAGPSSLPIGGQVLMGGATGLALGGIEGAVSGYGRGTDPASRTQEALRGAKGGAGFGAAFGAAGPVVGKGIENLVTYVRRTDVAAIASELGISKLAARVIRNTFDQGGDVQAAVANLQRAGDEAMLADAGPAAQALLDAAATSGGRAGQVVRKAVDERAERTMGRLEGRLDATLGQPPLGPRTKVAEIADRTRDDRQKAYDAAYAQQIDWDSPAGLELEGILRRVEPEVLQRAVDDANAQMRDLNEVNLHMRTRLNEEGELVFEAMPNVRQLDVLKKALGNQGEAARGPLGQATEQSQRYGRQAGDLRAAMGQHIPGYDEAVQLGGDKLAEERAFLLGAKLLEPQTLIEDVVLELGDKPSRAALEAARSGMRMQIAKVLGDVRAVASDPNIDARQVVEALRMTSSENARAKIRQLLGAEADELIRELDAASQSSIVRAAVAANSRTQARAAEQRSVEEITAPGMLGTLARGEPINTTKALVQSVTGQTSEHTAIQRQRIYQDIAKALTDKKGPEALRALEYIDRALAGQHLTEAEAAFLAQQLQAVGMISGEATGARAAERKDRELLR